MDDQLKPDFKAAAEGKTIPKSGTERQTYVPPALSREWPSGVGKSDWSKVPPKLKAGFTAAYKSKHWPVYIWGDPGRGKSCAAACIYMQWRGWAIWCSASDIVSQVLEARSKGSIFRNGVELWPGSIMRKITDATLVVFDDVAIRCPSDAGYEVFFNMVDSRRGKPTIFTSNVSPGALAKIYDSRITSRVLRGTIIELTGEDLRLKSAVVVKA